ncbi:membrane cofactor protein-like isoform X2 [Brienomyrus brachyistius]|uniref:membrane cofactor protein-like isoform X2 n=1 Tax=Brienomyrus brachyistius TaxID=42636 RepID=UPI0020B1802C|nr:membrane cofactor protein-like isoform X2 [Brienomyrus brachyistius]
MFGFKRLCCFVVVCVTFEVNANAQCSKPNTYPNVILAPQYSQENNFPTGAMVAYECVTGYIRMSGMKNSTCQDGKWSSLTLKCQKKSCGSPLDIINGRYNISEGTDFGAMIYAICNEGYILANQIEYRTCKEDGWDNHDPVCEAVNCGEPPTVLNGMPSRISDIRYQESVEYSCTKSYTLIGSSLITCSANGSFTPAPPNCSVVWCHEPSIANSRRLQGSPPYGYESFVVYECMKGYKMTGEGQLICDVNGWTPGIPTCSKVQPTTWKTPATSTTPTPRSTVHGSRGKGANITPHALSVAIGLLFPAILELFL